MEQSNKILTRTRITPEIALKMRINQYQKVKCNRCGVVALLGDLKPALYVQNISTGLFRPPDMGGNGYNFRCPNCKGLIYTPRW
jgi:phage FluMu protein Com